MLKKVPFFLAAGVLFALAATGVLGQQALTGFANTATASCTHNAHVTLPPADTHAVGVPALPITHPGHIPVFTKQDVLNYFCDSPNYSRITNILFIPNEQAISLMKGESTGLTNMKALVCYVEIKGPFVLNGVSRPYVPGPNGTNQVKPPVVQTLHYVFNASNGFLLVAGGI
ncbi:MAG TPA: hypothetical protein VJ761_09320 [Ktedonobacteraceae bacterium]|nr:hypothetical protein [Ktedonobacteraceae bacterium]